MMAVPATQIVSRTRVLLAEDEPVTRRLLEAQMTRFGYEVLPVADGLKAWDVLQTPDAPSLVVLDWNMPGLDGPEICQKIRESTRSSYTYMLLVTARNAKSDVVQGLSAGADDFISKPVDPDELHARLKTGERIVRLEQTLASQVKELQVAAEHVRELQGMIPICMHCKRIRNQSQIWEKVETYIENRSGAKFSHALCSECLNHHYPDADSE
ncbi:MAG: response regulator [Archangium sp.]|nr:response regulator [Archangium sp.]